MPIYDIHNSVIERWNLIRKKMSKTFESVRIKKKIYDVKGIKLCLICLLYLPIYILYVYSV